jgi:hypothetical protein
MISLRGKEAMEVFSGQMDPGPFSWFWDPSGSPMISFCGKEALNVFSDQMDPEALLLVLGPFRFTYDFLSWKGDSGNVFWPDGPGGPFPGFGPVRFGV